MISFTWKEKVSKTSVLCGKIGASSMHCFVFRVKKLYPSSLEFKHCREELIILSVLAVMTISWWPTIFNHWDGSFKRRIDLKSHNLWIKKCLFPPRCAFINHTFNVYWYELRIWQNSFLVLEIVNCLYISMSYLFLDLQWTKKF